MAMSPVHSASRDSPPAIVLVEPQLGGNIGAAARAMANFGLHDLRIVAPRDGWPNPEAWARASGAHGILETAGLFGTVAEAVADRQVVFATTARVRELPRPERTPRQAVGALRADPLARSAILFGAERAGLCNADLATAEAVIRVPTDPDFASINLAQAVLLLAYEWWLAGLGTESPGLGFESELASRKDVAALAGHLERELDSVGYFHPPERRPSSVAQLHNVLFRQRLTEGEVRMLRGVIRALRRERRS